VQGAEGVGKRSATENSSEMQEERTWTCTCRISVVYTYLLLTDGVGCRLCQKDFCDPLRRRDLGVAGVAAVQSPLESIERIIQGLAAVLGNARAGAEFTLFEKCWLFEDLNPKLRAAFERSLEPCFGRLLMEWSK